MGSPVWSTACWILCSSSGPAPSRVGHSGSRHRHHPLLAGMAMLVSLHLCATAKDAADPRLSPPSAAGPLARPAPWRCRIVYQHAPTHWPTLYVDDHFRRARKPRWSPPTARHPGRGLAAHRRDDGALFRAGPLVSQNCCGAGNPGPSQNRPAALHALRPDIPAWGLRC